MARWPNRVLKRDGRRQVFDLVRLTSSIQAALQAVGNPDPSSEDLASQLASMVAVATQEDIVETASLAAAVESALDACGCAPAAQAFAHVRRLTMAHLQRLRVHTDGAEPSEARPWDRARLARSLMRDRHLESQHAWDVAHRLERRLVAGEFRHITGRLLAALAENECRTLGLGGDPLGPDPVGIGRRELDAWLGGECVPGTGGPSLTAPGVDPRPLLGGEVLARYALEEILPRKVLRFWERGAFDIPSLRDWTRSTCLRLAPASGEEERAYWKRVGRALFRTAEVQAWWGRPTGSQDVTVLAPAWLKRPHARLRLVTNQVELAFHWAREGHFIHLDLSSYLLAEPSLRRRMQATDRILLTHFARSPRHRPRQRVAACAVVNLVAALGSSTDEFLSQAAQIAGQAAQAALALHTRTQARPPARLALLPAGLDLAVAHLGLELHSSELRRLLHSLVAHFRTAAENIGSLLDSGLPPHTGSVGVRLAGCFGEENTPTFSVGWNPAPDHPRPPQPALDAVPVLVLPAVRGVRGVFTLHPPTSDPS